MAYIGKTPTIGNFQVCDAISVVNGQAAYTLQVGGTNVAPESANHMLVSLNGILQKPGSSFTISGSTMTFASNLATGDVIDFVQILGNVLDLGVPSDATVTTAKIVDGAVTSAKLASGVLGFTNGTKVSPTGVSQVTITGIPSTARMVVIGTDSLSFTGGGNTDFAIRIGDSGGIETTGYASNNVYLSTNTGEASPGGNSSGVRFAFAYQPDQSDTVSSQMILTCMDPSTNTWNFSSLSTQYPDGYIQCAAGIKSLSDTLTQVQIFTVGGENWDSGSINIMYI